MAVYNVPPEGHLKQAFQSSFLYFAGGLVLPVVGVLNLDEGPGLAFLTNPNYAWRMHAAVIFGIVSGVGTTCGVLSQVGLRADTALLNVIMNGIYTIGCSLAICTLYMESPTVLQLLGAIAVVVGVVFIDGLRPKIQPVERLLADRSLEEATLPHEGGLSTGKPVLLAICGGVLWAIGALGQRIGVEKTNNSALKKDEACITAFAWTCGLIISPMCGTIYTCMQQRQDSGNQYTVPNDSGQLAKYWVIIVFLGGLASGVASILCTYSLALAGDESALLMMVTNGSFCLLTFLFISLTFCETAGFGQLVGGFLILLGILLAST